MPVLNTDKLPRHLAIIMDGNGRWAKERMLQRIIGHQKGVETVRSIVEECSAIGIGYLTLYAFSAENWLRPKTEVRALMGLLKKYIKMEIPRMLQNNIRFNVIGNSEELPADVNQSVADALEKTSRNTGMVLTLALSYGGRQEIVGAAAKIAAAVAACEYRPEDIDEKLFESHLFTYRMPDPDFMIRTSGEMRVSNFLLWQIAYAELYFTDVNWPDFGKAELHKALAHFQARERRFGLTSDQIHKRS